MGYSALTAKDLATMQRNAGSQSVLKTTPDIDEEINEHELEAHYSFMAKIQDVLPEESSSTEQPLEQIQNNDDINVFANER
ncbi:hypothetical protein Tco_0148318 [Tanacetum coccineum]